MCSARFVLWLILSVLFSTRLKTRPEIIRFTVDFSTPAQLGYHFLVFVGVHLLT